MGLFSFGGSKSRSSSRSSSSSFDNLDASSFNFGVSGDRSESVSGGSSSSFDRSGARSGSRQQVAFEEVFANLFGNATGAAGRAASQSGNLTGAANMLFNSGGDIIDQLQGGGVGADFLESRITGADQLADAQVDQLGADLERFLAEDVSGAITSRGVSAGTLGGSRGEVQAGIAERGAAEAFVRGSTDIRSRSRSQTDQLAQALMASESERGATALSALPGLFGLAEGGNMAELSPFLALSQILGPQLALTESESESFGLGGSESEQFSRALAEAFGFNVGGSSTTGRAGSQSSSSSSSKSKSIKFGFD